MNAFRRLRCRIQGGHDFRVWTTLRLCRRCPEVRLSDD